MGKIISVSNQKGGVGKTTTALNLSACLGILEQKVLLIDLDPQANATSGIGIDLKKITGSSYQLLEHTEKAENVIIKSNTPNLDIIPSTIDLVAIELELVNHPNREFMLKKALDTVKENYDYVIIDCAPSLGLITLNALTASNSVIIPIQCEYFALEGLGKLLNTIKIIQQRLNNNLIIEGLLLTMYDTRLRLSNQVVEEVKTHFQDMVFKTIIHRNVRLGESPSYGETIIIHDAASKGAINYLNLANEIISKHKIESNKDTLINE